MPAYEVLLSYPKSAMLEIVADPPIPLARGELPIPEDPDTAVPEAAIPWNAYSPSSEVTGEVVYVNFGRAEDYERLAAMGIDPRGRIVLARYSHGYRGGKALEAEKRGALAILVYSDPIEDGWFRGPVYPEGPWGPASHFQRGSNVYDFLVPGDPLTPGWASTPDAKRVPMAEAESLPKIPMMPLSWRDAAEILARLGGRAVPDAGWQGLAVADTFRVGPGPVRVHMKIENTREKRTIKNVIATLRGSELPEQKILLSNHFDAWIYGAVDPSSGTASMLALARALGRLAAEGYRPRRTIVIGEWDAEEYTLTGSTEWGEQYAKELRQSAVVCINVDASALGREFAASASPLLVSAIRDAARDFPDPSTPGKSLADSWRATAAASGAAPGARSCRSRSSGAARTTPSSSTTWASPRSISSSTGPTACTTPSTTRTAGWPRRAIPDSCTTRPWPSTPGCWPSDTRTRTFSRSTPRPTAGRSRSTERSSSPFPEPSLSGRRCGGSCPTPAPGARRPPRRRRRSPRASPPARAERSRSARPTPGCSRSNARSSTRRGSRVGPWFRHLVYAPLPSYEAETLPAIREAILSGQAESAGLQIQRLSEKLSAATASARKAESALKPK